ncbi:MAG TPA: DoxX family protein [Blastocatellia bacterium]|nr:DoxX family protein [Blastocatellia bacterium]
MTARRDISPLHAPEDKTERSKKRPMMTYVLWTVQVLLALLFLFSGGAKLALSAEAMKGPVDMPVPFLRFIGVCEVLGALGLILPGIFRIARGLTPLAAAGLVIIMIGATVVNIMSGAVPVALLTIVVGLLAAFVAYGNWKAISHR